MLIFERCATCFVFISTFSHEYTVAGTGIIYVLSSRNFCYSKDGKNLMRPQVTAPIIKSIIGLNKIGGSGLS